VSWLVSRASWGIMEWRGIMGSTSTESRVLHILKLIAGQRPHIVPDILQRPTCYRGICVTM
jgi:hypothetical protein